MIKDFFKKLSVEIKVISVIAIIYLFSYFINHPIGCIIYNLTSIECPSCGMTSAWYWFLKGDISLAFYYHPLFITPLLAAILYVVDAKVKRIRYINAYYIIMACLFLIVYIIRITFDIDMFVPLDTHFDLFT